jgi:hypothetical protein
VCGTPFAVIIRNYFKELRNNKDMDRGDEKPGEKFRL